MGFNPTQYLDMKFSDLNAALRGLDEEQCWKLLQEELKRRARHSYVSRLHGRFNRLRFIRERSEFIATIGEKHEQN